MRLYPSECLVLPFLVLSVFWSYALGIPLRPPGELYFSRLVQCAVVYAIGLCLALLVLRLKDLRNESPGSFKQTLENFRRDFLSKQVLQRDLRLVHSIALMFFSFVQLKHLTPFINAERFDEVLLQHEKRLFAGQLLAERLQAVFGVTSADLFAESYVAFYPFMAILLGYFILQRNFPTSSAFITAFSATWLFGILCVHLFPTWGPCFAAPESVASLPTTKITSLQSDMWKHWLFVQQHPYSRSGVFLISGFPSLHLAVPILGMIFSYRFQRLVFFICTIFAVLTAFSTIYFAWHYLADDIGSLALAVFAAWLGRFLTGRYLPEESRTC